MPLNFLRYDAFEALQNSCRDTTPTLLTINYKILKSTLVFTTECGESVDRLVIFSLASDDSPHSTYIP